MAPTTRIVGMLGNAVNTLKTSVDAILQMSKLEAGAEHADFRPLTSGTSFIDSRRAPPRSNGEKFGMASEYRARCRA